MKVKVTHKFKDKHTRKTYDKGNILDISDERYIEIMSVGNFVMQISEIEQKDENADSSNDADASSDGFDEMSIRELREYADKAYKLTFKGGMKKAEIIEILRRREQHE